MFSSDTRSIKPSTTLFRAAIADTRHGPDSILMIGDSLHADMRGARRVGLATAWIAPPARSIDLGLESLVDYRIPSVLSLAGVAAPA